MGTPGKCVVEARSARLVLPVLVLLLAATAGLAVYAVFEVDAHTRACDEAIVRAEETGRVVAALHVRAARARAQALSSAAPWPSSARPDPPDPAVLKERALRSDDPAVVVEALRALGSIRQVAGSPELVALLRDPRPQVRYETIGALGKSGEDSVVPLLVPLTRDDDLKARRHAIQALGRLGSDRAVTELRLFLHGQGATQEDRLAAAAAIAAAHR